LRFIGAAAVTQHEISAAVGYSSVQNMRRLERADAFDDPRLRAGEPSDPDSYKVRRGVVGGYVDYLSPGDLAYIGRVLALRRAFERQRPTSFAPAQAARSSTQTG
jgi:hypothetical protein